MPFEKKKRQKTKTDYVTKGLYLDPNNEFHAELLQVFDVCSHKQAKLLGIMAHDYFTRIGIDINSLSKERFNKLIKAMEYCAKEGIDSKVISYLDIDTLNKEADISRAVFRVLKSRQSVDMMQIPPFGFVMPTPVQAPVNKVEEEDNTDSESVVGDLSEMNEALAAFGI